ncbi:3-isopropylmalate dehydratase large subunit [Comamonas sp. PE63]|uniref:3-isopropylmalate dehydratase large subunit n=1 Tax=Comamonas brasiliensis TaxID=1812482 RepID=A0ABS5LLL7_9BURK|nr:aconitase family protein [Comamonas sp. PE63]MBS3017390.1 3-isopropylmalate dehydratase large subunit [Comamonas sp. PE63]
MQTQLHSAARFSPRILYLSQCPATVKKALGGQPVRLADALPLRDDVSTDEITPIAILTHFDNELGRYPYTGFRTQGELPVAVDAMRDSRIQVVVAGRRYGKGSSREHSPAAEKLAGVRLVIAESFERIYRQNADNIGLITSTDFSLIARIEAGEAIGWQELVHGRDALAAAILREGGLLPFGRAHLGRISAAPEIASRPRTLFEKIVTRHALTTGVTVADPAPGDGAFVRADWRFIHEYYTGMAAHMLHAAFDRPLHLSDPGSILVFEDHTSYVEESPTHVREGLVPKVHRMVRAQRDFAGEYGLLTHRTLTELEARAEDGRNVAGISHAMMAERYALPGQLVVGTDSHTPHSGALGCVAFGIGTTDMANAFVTGAVRLTVPESLRIVLDGELSANVTAKDVVLHLLAQPYIRAGGGVGKVFEFTGAAIARMSTDERATLTNMSAELGGFTGIVAPDAETLRFLLERRAMRFVIEDWMHSDPDASYAQTIRIDCSAVPVMVASPGDPGNGRPLAAIGQKVRIDIAYGGSCTAGKREDFERYHEVLQWAADRGLRVAAGVDLFLQFGTTAVRDHCLAAGYLEAFERVGARMLQPSCGACGNCGPGGSIRPDQVTVSAINRNFPGRGGPGSVWLASPSTVAASAIAGELLSFEELRQRHSI